MSMAMASTGVVVGGGVGGGGGMERLALVTGILYVGMAVGCMTGAPTSGAILDGAGNGREGWGGVVAWTGGMMFLEGCMVVGVKVKTSRRLLDRV